MELLAKGKRYLKADAQAGKGGEGLRYDRDQDDKPLTLEDMIKLAEGAEEIILSDTPLPVERNDRPQRTEAEEAEAKDRFLSSVPEGTRFYKDTTATQRVIKAASTAAQDEIGQSPLDTRRTQSGYGPFSGYRSAATVEQDLDGNPELHIEFYGAEQLDAGLTDTPAQTIVVKEDGNTQERTTTLQMQASPNKRPRCRLLAMH